MFAALAFDWEAPPGLRPPPGNAYRAYPLILQLLHSVDPALARTLHNSDPKRIAVRPLRQLRTTPHTEPPPPRWWTRVSFLGGDIVGATVAALARLPADYEGRLGEIALRLTAVHLTPLRHPAVRVATVDDLLAGDWTGPDPLVLRLETPTGFRLPQGQQGLLPTPGLVFGSLLARWQALVPERPLAADRAAFDRDVRVERLRLRSVAMDFGEFKQLGVVGEVGYGTTRAELRRALLALARLAEFSGIGAKTAMGMGGARLMAL